MTTVLYVDDSHLGRTVARLALSSAGYTVIEAADGMAGFNAACTHRPDCIVAALDTPVLDGIEFLRRLRVEGSGWRIVIVAACGREETIDRCIKLGAHCVIERARLEQDLPEVVASALGASDRAAA